MNREDILDLILKAAAVYLFVLAVIALASVFGTLFGMLVLMRANLTDYAGSASYMTPGLSGVVSGMVRVALYVLIGRSLFNGAPWVRRILGAR